jgi:digeranylgeranylglycerophospholipid reductase
MKYDVVVIGGNLAGTSAAINALEKGANVALIEKNLHPYDPPHCGEGIDSITTDFINLKKINCHMNPTKKIVINLTKKYEYSFDTSNNGLIIFDRKHLEQELLKKTIEDGAKVLLGTKANQFKPPHDVITNSNETISGKIIIDASGIQCVIGKKVGIKTKINAQDIGVCIQSRVKGVFDSNIVKIWFDKPFAPYGYGWVFPIDNEYANIGLGIPGGQKLKLDSLLRDYINYEKKKGVEILSTFRSCVPLTRPAQNIIKDNVLLTGDAARLVNPFLGSGIENAIFSGCLAGNVAVDFLDHKLESLELYQHLLRNKINRLTKSYIRREKIYENDRIVPVYHKALIAFNIASKIIPDYFNRSVKKVVEKDIALVCKYKKTSTLF